MGRGMIKKFIKLYYPMVISILFLCFITFVFIVNLKGIAFDGIIWILLVECLLFVIGIWAEIIGYIIHAVKNKNLKNKVLWVILIYYLYIFVIPYYHLKYVNKSEKVLRDMIIFGILMICSLIIGIGYAKIYMNDKISDGILYIVNDNKSVQFQFEGNYSKRKVGQYDIYASDKSRGINIGAFVYDDENSYLYEEIHKDRVSWLYSARDSVALVSSYQEIVDDKEIISKVFFGKSQDVSFAYTLTTFEFIDTGVIVDIIQICYLENYESLKDELMEIVLGVKYIGE